MYVHALYIHMYIQARRLGGFRGFEQTPPRKTEGPQSHARWVCMRAVASGVLIVVVDTVAWRV